jgi:ASPIC and UnbV/FG-GAP-like repeat
MLSRHLSHWRRALLALPVCALFVLPVLLVKATDGSTRQNSPSSKPLAYFTDIAKEAGLTMMNVFGGENTKKYIIETTGTGVAIFDYDNDGWPDILVADGHIENEIEKVQKRVSYAEPPHLFRNLGGGKFQEVTASLGPAFAAPRVARGAAYADIDNDGSLDVLMTTNGGRVYLFHNEGGANHSLRIKLKGTKSNRDGIGAVVHVTSGSAKQWQMLRSGSSYLSQSELVLTFGLGKGTKADSIEVGWPSGQTDKLSNIDAGQTVTVEEGKGAVSNRQYGNRSHSRLSNSKQS